MVADTNLPHLTISHISGKSVRSLAGRAFWNREFRLMAFGVFFASSRMLAAYETPRCAPQQLRLTYAPLGRAASVEGKVVLTVDIDAAGKPTIIEEIGHPLLVGPSKSMLSSASFPGGCANRKLTITINYRLRDLSSPYQEDSVVAVSQNTYVVTGSRLVISDPSPDLRRAPWWKRFWRRIT